MARIQKRCGCRKRGRGSEAYPFGKLSEVDAMATGSLKGEGKNKMKRTYKTRRINGAPWKG